MDFQIHAATAHLWLEEFTTDREQANLDKAQLNLAEAVKLSKAILHGGETEHGIVLSPPDEPALRTKVETINRLFTEFASLAELRRLHPDTSGIGTVIDEHFDQVFAELEDMLKALEENVEVKQQSDHAKSTRLFYGLFIAWSLIVVMATAGVWRHESGRKRAEAALRNAKDGLETRVAQRTEELRHANEQLSLELVERKQIEEALLESEKEAARAAHLASLGELAAGVAHEINNPVNGIINCAEILVNKGREGSRERELGGRIVKEGDRIAYIVKGLLTFAREETEGKVPVHVREILADVLALTEAQMRREGITLEVDIPGDVPPIFARPQQIEQVFLNIVNNARDALNQRYPEMHQGKTLRIAAQRVMTYDRPYARVSFHDQGTGVPANLMSRVMNPFFSTKPRGKGTGLGLSISHGIISNHGGRLVIDSVEGEFTEVAVELPAQEG
jgi:C4-dicarboxylate-specific signal transduction histidine kinase